MYCRECGAELPDDARFCVSCGAYVDDSPPVSRPPAKKGSKGTGAAGIIIIAILAVVVVGFVFAGQAQPVDEDDRVVVLGDMTLRGGLYDDSIQVSVHDGVGTLTYAGDGEAAWVWKDACAPVYERSMLRYTERQPTTTVSDTLSFTVPGKYEVSLYVDGVPVRSGEVVLDGDVERTWVWSRYDDGHTRTYTVSWIFTFSDFLEYSEDDAYRRMNMESDARFVIVDDSILSLEDALSESYARVHGHEPVDGSQDYADFMLSFVQMAITYPPSIEYIGGQWRETDDGSPDTYLYGQDEYWAYPMETLYMRQGDCEDTSFLACALFSAAGYDSAVATPPEHMMALVKLDSFQRDTAFERWYTGITYGSVTLESGDVYRPCETTYDVYAAPAGYYNEELQADLDELEYIYTVPPYVAPEGATDSR